MVSSGYRYYECCYPILSETSLQLAPCPSPTSPSLLDSHLVLRGKLPSSRRRAAGEREAFGSLRTGCPSAPTYLQREEDSRGTTWLLFSLGRLPQQTQDVHPRPNKCMEGAVVPLESPVYRRRNLDSKQDVLKVKAFRVKWKLAAGPAGPRWAFRRGFL